MNLITGEKAGGGVAAIKVDAEGRLVLVEATPARTPLVATLVVTNAAAVALSGAAPDGAEVSPAAWTLIVPSGGADVRLGGSGVTTSTGLVVAAGTSREIPSATLAGWYAIAEAGSVTVELLGAEDAAP